jgi:predicted aspartyl protease
LRQASIHEIYHQNQTTLSWQRLLFAITLIILLKPVMAQEENIVGFYLPVISDAREPQPSPVSDEVIIPFKKVGNLILIEASVDDKTGYFIFDTGAPYLVLNATYFRKYPRTRQFAAVGVNNSEIEIFRTEVESLDIRGVKYANVEADVANLGHIENARNTRVLGLLGTNLFTEFVVGINFNEQKIILTKAEHFAQKSEVKQYGFIPFKLRNNTLALNGQINGKNLSFVFDTGAEINVLDNDLPDAVYEQFIIQKRSTLQGSVEGNVEVFTGMVLRTEIDSLPFMQMRAIMTDLRGLGRVYGYPVDGILGYEFIRKGPLWIHFPEKKLYLPKKKFYE